MFYSCEQKDGRPALGWCALVGPPRTRVTGAAGEKSGNLPGKIVRVPINSLAFLGSATAGALGMLQGEVRITHRAGDHSLGSTHFIIFRGAPSLFNR
jgi:hypothetical protein